VNGSTGGKTNAIGGAVSNSSAPVLRAEGATGNCTINSSGEVACTGAVKTLASTHGGSRTVETYAVHSSENWMEDFGTARIDNGRVVVTIDAEFAEAANLGVAYHVFLTPNGDAQPLYVANKTATTFEVRESNNGGDNISFDYRIVAKRRGYESNRLTDVTAQVAAENAAAAQNKARSDARKASAQKSPASGSRSISIPQPVASSTALPAAQ
jgi:hypothetical protein